MLKTEIKVDINFFFSPFKNNKQEGMHFYLFLLYPIQFSLNPFHDWLENRNCVRVSILKRVFIGLWIAVQVDCWLQLISGNRRLQSIRFMPEDWLHQLLFCTPIRACHCSLSLWFNLNYKFFHILSYILSVKGLFQAHYKNIFCPLASSGIQPCG